MKNLTLLVCYWLALLPVTGQAQGRVTSTSTSVRTFVQVFYDWYARKAVTGVRNAESTWETALHEKASCFSPELRRQLRADSQAQAKVRGEVVGLDFDPFIDSQDPDRYYRVLNVVSKDKTYLVEVHRVVSGKVAQQRTVTAEVVGKKGKWYFVNFRYLNGPSLLGVLQAIQKSQGKINP
jgi:hypothetical protein